MLSIEKIYQESLLDSNGFKCDTQREKTDTFYLTLSDKQVGAPSSDNEDEFYKQNNLFSQVHIPDINNIHYRNKSSF